MPQKIADTLVVAFTYGVSVRTWAETGMLHRELALYHALAPHYNRIILISYGDATDQTYLAQESLEHQSQSQQPHTPFTLVCNDTNLSSRDYVASLPERLNTLIANDSSVVFKSNQLSGGDVALRIAEHCRKSNPARLVACIGRGGYPWSRLLAHQFGAASTEALTAGEREATLCQGADLVVGTTDSMVADLSWRYGVPQNRTAVIPNYVLIEDDPEAKRDDCTILYAGQLVPVKRVDLLIEAMAQFTDLVSPERAERTTLLIVGEGSERAALEAQAKERNLRVEFRNRVPHAELLKLMRTCAVYTQASETEGHPKTVIEAMASGAPVVVAQAPGLSDVVAHGATGIVTKADPAAFALSFSELLQDADWREMLGAGAQQSARAAYGLPSILIREIAAHEKALALAKAGPREATPPNACRAADQTSDPFGNHRAA